MNATIINLIFCAVLALFILFGFLWGIKRGLKRTALRGVWLIITVVAILFLSSIISNAIIKSDILSLFNIEHNGTQVNNITEYVTLYAADFGISSTNANEFVNLIVALIGLALNSIIFLILFWVLKVLLTPLYWLICRLVLRDKKKEKQTITTKSGKQKVVKKTVKVKKHRLLGGAVGVLVGAIVCVATLTPVVGYLNIAKSIEEESKEQSGEGLVSSMLGEDNYALLNDGYYNSTFNKIYTYTGLNFLSQTAFNTLTTTKINGETVSLNEEGKQIVKIYAEVNGLEVIDLNTCTKAEFDVFLNKINSIILTAFDSGLVSSSSELLMDIASDVLKNKLDISEMPEYSQELITAVINNLAELNSASVKEELINVVKFAKALNNTNVLLPLIQGKTDDMLTFLQANLTEENISAVVNSLFELKLVSNVATELANTIVGFIAANINEDYSEVGTIENETLKNTLLNITSSAVGALKGLDFDSQYVIKVDGIAPVGKFINTILNSALISDSFEDVIIDKLQTEALNFVNESELETFISNFAKGVINNLDNVTNYETEFNYIQTFANLVNESLNGQGLDSIDITKVSFAKLGKGLDELEKSVLVKDDNNGLVNDLVVDALDYLKTNESVKEYSLTCLDEIKQNINSTLSVNWESDLGAINNLVLNVKEIIDKGDYVNQLQTDNEKFLELGVQLDEVKTTQIIGNNGVNALVKDILNLAKDSFGDSNIESKVKDAVNVINNNILLQETYSWETEFKHICSLMEDDYEEITISDLSVFGRKFDNILNGYETADETVNKSEIITKQVIDTSISGVFDDVLKTQEGSTQFDLTEIKNAFTDNDLTDDEYTNNITSYESEFEVFNRLYQLTGYDFTVSTDAEAMGAEIDEIVALNSAVITKTYINDYLKDVISDKLPSDIDPQFDSVVNNIIGSDNNTPADPSDDVPSRLDTMTSTYESEFLALNKIYEILNNETTTTIANLTAITTYPGEALGKTLGARLDEIKDSQLVGDAGIIVLQSALKSYKTDAENADYADIITEIEKNVASLSLTSTSPYETTFSEISTFNNEINEIKEKVDGVMITSDIAEYLDQEMETLQSLNIINYNATAKIASYAMDEIDETLSNTPVTEFVTNARDYITAYKIYLGGVTGNVPYNSSTETTAEITVGTETKTIPVNKPFAKIVTLLSSAV